MIPGAEDPTFDAILGMTFCKQTTRIPSVCQFAEPRPRSRALISNVYLLLDYGDFYRRHRGQHELSICSTCLSTTNPAEAHADFVATRLNRQDTTSWQHYSTGSGNADFFQEYRIPNFAALYDPAPLGDMPMQYVTGYSAPAPYAHPWSSRR